VCTGDEAYVDHLRAKGIDVFTYGLKRSLRPVYLLRAVFRVKKILLERQIDVLICHSPLGAGIGRLAARLAKTRRVIYFAHGLPCAPAQNPFLWFLWFAVEKILALFTDAILVMNNYDENLARRHLVKNPAKVLRVPGVGVDLTKFSIMSGETDKRKIAAELNVPRDQKMVLCATLLKPAKGIFVYIEAARKICAQRSDVCFLLAGDGPGMGRIKELCAKYNLQERFKILGWRDDVRRLMEAADIFVLPSYYFEGLPVSILEAMACAKPVVSTKHRGCEDAVDNNRTGFLVPVKQAIPLADKISILLNDAELCRRMGLAGRQRAEQCFELSYCTEKIIDALEMSTQEN
jgi:glycosyltransferase EpsD